MKPMPSSPAPYLPTSVDPADLVDPWLEISKNSLRWNVSEVRRLVGGIPIMAVVKGNAYGHGTVGVAHALEDAGVDRFAVVKVGEAVALREAGIEGEILNMGAFSPNEAETLVELGVSQSAFTNAVTDLAAAAAAIGRPARVHVKVDTGLSRVGVPYGLAHEFIARVAAMPRIEIAGVFTTLTEEADFDAVQIQRLNQACDAAVQTGVSVPIRHAASSSSVAERPETHLDMVRPGNALYGLESLPNMELRQAMSLKARVVLVKDVKPGDTVGYHRVRRVDEVMRLATIPVGYADGYPPVVADKADVLIRGHRRPVIAYISANHSLIDVTGSDVEIGDEVVLVGSQGEDSIPLTELAAHSGRTVYQLATGMSPLLPRGFVD